MREGGKGREYTQADRFIHFPCLRSSRSGSARDLLAIGGVHLVHENTRVQNVFSAGVRDDVEPRDGTADTVPPLPHNHPIGLFVAKYRRMQLGGLIRGAAIG